MPENEGGISPVPAVSLFKKGGRKEEVKVEKDEKIEKEEIEEEVKKEGEVEIEVEEPTEVTELKPPEVEIIEEAINFIEERLPQVYGASTYTKIIVNTLKDDPTPLRDGYLLSAHIKSLAPRVHEQQLATIVIKPLYTKFPQLPMVVDKYLTESYHTSYPTHTYPMYAYPAYPSYPSYLPYPHPHQPYSHYQYYPYLYPAKEKERRTYKVVIDGQVFETDDPKEYFAWKEWEDRRAREEERRKREEEEHKLKMMKLEEELKLLAKERGKEKEGEAEAKRSENEIVKMFASKVESLERKLEEERKRKEEDKKEIEELKKMLAEKEKRELINEINALKAELESTKQIAANPWKVYEQQEEILRRLGYTRTGKSLLDILDKGVEGVQQTIQMLVHRLPAPKGGVKYTEAERRERMDQIKQKVEQIDELIAIEDELINTAKELYRSGD